MGTRLLENLYTLNAPILVNLGSSNLLEQLQPFRIFCICERGNLQLAVSEWYPSLRNNVVWV